MQHVSTSIVGTAGVLVGAVAGIGAVSLLAGDAAPAAEPVVEERVVVVPSGELPEQPDRIVGWLKQNPR